MAFNPCNACGVLVDDEDAFEATGGLCEACDADRRPPPAPVAQPTCPLTHIPTGHGDQVLCLQVHTGTVWAGLYPSMAAGAPLEIGVAARRSGARIRGHHLVVGEQAFPLDRAPLRCAVVWLDHHGVRTREAAP